MSFSKADKNMMEGLYSSTFFFFTIISCINMSKINSLNYVPDYKGKTSKNLGQRCSGKTP